MNDPIRSDKKNHTVGTWFFILFSSLSLIVAVASVVYTTRTNLDRDRISIIDSIDEDISKLTTILIQNPHLCHLVASPKDYPRVFNLVLKSLEGTSKQRLIEMLLTEETMTISLANLYERILTEIDYATSRRYSTRVNYLRFQLKHFEQELFLNPRISFLFQNSLEHVSPKVRKYYDQNIRRLSVSDPEPDNAGPILHALKRIDPQFTSPQ